jgi:hypothetical protein
VEVNERRLMDHDIDLYSNWNMKVNGRYLMDIQEVSDCMATNRKIWNGFKDSSDNSPKERSENGYYDYWNISVDERKNPKITNKPKRKPDEVKRKPFKNEIIYWTNEEDKEAEVHKMFRPLYLLPSQEPC